MSQHRCHMYYPSHKMRLSRSLSPHYALANSRSFAWSRCRVVTLWHSRAVALSRSLSRSLLHCRTIALSRSRALSRALALSRSHALVLSRFLALVRVEYSFTVSHLECSSTESNYVPPLALWCSGALALTLTWEEGALTVGEAASSVLPPPENEMTIEKRGEEEALGGWVS